MIYMIQTVTDLVQSIAIVFLAIALLAHMLGGRR